MVGMGSGGGSGGSGAIQALDLLAAAANPETTAARLEEMANREAGIVDRENALAHSTKEMVAQAEAEAADIVAQAGVDARQLRTDAQAKAQEVRDSASGVMVAANGAKAENERTATALQTRQDELDDLATSLTRDRDNLTHAQAAHRGGVLKAERFSEAVAEAARQFGLIP